MRNCGASLGVQIFHIMETQAESVVEPDSVADDLEWKPISALAGRRTRHRPTLLSYDRNLTMLARTACR